AALPSELCTRSGRGHSKGRSRCPVIAWPPKLHGAAIAARQASLPARRECPMEIMELWTVSSEWALANVLNVITALVVLVGGWHLSGVLSRGSRELLPKTRRVDNTIAPLLSQVVRYGVLLVTLVIVLSQFGVQTASILAVLGAAGLAIALALQGTLSNLASG